VKRPGVSGLEAVSSGRAGSMGKRRYTGVILSAGKGSRIDPFNTHFPKPMLPIVNRPILEHQIGYMRELGIDDVIVVVGHLQEVIRQHLGDGSRLGVRVRYVEQVQTLGIAHAVMQLERHIDAPFLLFLGDIFHVPKDLGAMLRIHEDGGAGAVIAVQREEDPAAIRKNFSVQMDARGRVTRVVEKPRFLVNDLKGCGMYLFGPEIFDAIRQTPRTALRDEYELTNAIQIFIDTGHVVQAAEVVDWDYNITFPADLLDCNRRVLRMLGQRNAVAPTARIHPGAVLDGAVVGERVVVDAPVRITNTVILPDTRIEGGEDLEDCLLSRDICIRCTPPGGAPAPVV
jgi:NDP-sugar pyrophosphorylase family protein